MQMQDYVVKYDHLSSEESLYNIPLRKEYLLSQIGRGKRVLDVGCLGGMISQLIKKQNNVVWGIDLNPAAAKAAQRRGIKVRIANIEEGLPFEDSFFDFINAGEVVEHIYDTKHFFQECHRVLRPKGHLIFTTPNLNSLENRVRIVSGGYLSMIGAYPEDHFGNHVRVFNIAKVRELCASCGFKLEEVRGIPALESKGRLFDLSLGFAGRLLPSLAKLLIVKAQKSGAN